MKCKHRWIIDLEDLSNRVFPVIMKYCDVCGLYRHMLYNQVEWEKTGLSAEEYKNMLKVESID